MTAAALTPLAPGVHAWLDPEPALAHPNAGVVVDEDGVTVLDTLCVGSQWGPFGDAVDALGAPVRRIVLTSSHLPYAGGTTRFARARWCKPPLRSARGTGRLSAARSPSEPSRCASAIPPSPPPYCQRNSRRFIGGRLREREGLQSRRLAG